MRKILLLLILGLLACSEKEDEELSPFVGTWVVTEMGIYEISDCKGEIDDTEWRGLKGKGFTITLELKKDGTGIETITGPGAKVTTFTWYDAGGTICIIDQCNPYDMPNNQLSFHIDQVKDPYCIDENYAVTGHTSKRDCENASTGNEWFPKECHKIKYKKQI
ncbi:MAG: hypothetical protein ISR82_04460 [Candidatus Marinimicrobia bacterium]|nr:hypothetical protein [Candidatus Neomarinimicrobiota bacterium]MBL7010454.1 hypothetical protein [Candidatus Neomarinimicrobiota bacterium]MBL7030050.1 hypothetical protein [Candidatus Neomarinimicrobiota bacterium]